MITSNFWGGLGDARSERLCRGTCHRGALYLPTSVGTPRTAAMLRMTSHNCSWTNNCFNLSDCDDEHSNNALQEDARIGRRGPRLTNRGPPKGAQVTLTRR